MVNKWWNEKKNEVIFAKGREKKEIISDEKEMYYKCHGTHKKNIALYFF